MLDHEYSLIGGINRAQIGRYIAITSALISAVLVGILLAIVDLAERFGLSPKLTPGIIALISAGMVFAGLYWTFSRYVWRWKHISALLKVPNLSGDWTCEGKTIGPDGAATYEWEATVTIVQCWDKLRIRLKTAQSGSNSATAALVYDAAEGYRLLYSYKNDPKLNEVQLTSHHGFCEIVFSHDLATAEGCYFNGRGRTTHGVMTWKRK